ncbi:MAG: hypothetical protein Q4B26_03125 [Eubacteriales bacterium]|nr:hypothetical protein [Eubacteriales bacterium]
MAQVYLEIDASNMLDKVETLRSMLTEEQFERAMAGIFRRTEGHVRKVLKADLPKKYEIKPGRVGAAVGHASVSNMSCTIPVRSERLKIGSGFSAKGGAHGWNTLRRSYRVKAKIVKSGVSTLPARAGSYGGYPPFRNLSASKLNGLTFTRETKARFPIRPVAGIAIPQMPMNRSQADVQNDIRKYLEERIEARIQSLLSV